MRRWQILGGTAAAIAVVGGGAAWAASRLDSTGTTNRTVVGPGTVLPGTVLPGTVLPGTVLPGTVVPSTVVPRRGFGFGFGRDHGGRGQFGPFADLGAAATYLGITTDQLRTDLQGGKTLAQVATGNGKTADGLVAAMSAAGKKTLDSAVAAGGLSADQAKQLEATMTRRIAALVNGRSRQFMPGFGGRISPGFRGPGFRGPGSGGYGPGRPGPPQSPA